MYDLGDARIAYTYQEHNFVWDTLTKLAHENEYLKNRRRRGRDNRTVGNARGKPGAPLSNARRISREAFAKGSNYYSGLLAATISEMMGELISECYSKQGPFEQTWVPARPLSYDRKRAVMAAVGREWSKHTGTNPPGLPPGWWKDSDLVALNRLAYETAEWGDEKE